MSCNEKLIATKSAHELSKIFDITKPLTAIAEDLLAVTFSSRENFFVVAHLDNTFDFYDYGNKEVSSLPSTFHGTVIALALSPDNTTLAVASSDNSCFIFDITQDAAYQPLFTIRGTEEIKRLNFTEKSDLSIEDINRIQKFLL